MAELIPLRQVAVEPSAAKHDANTYAEVVQVRPVAAVGPGVGFPAQASVARLQALDPYVTAPPAPREPVVVKIG